MIPERCNCGFDDCPRCHPSPRYHRDDERYDPDDERDRVWIEELEG